MVRDFSQGKIYKLYSGHNLNLIYIGSTTRTLEVRRKAHIYDKLLSVMEILNLGDVKIDLIHDFPCNNNRELEEEEQRVIDTFPEVVNRTRAFRTCEQHKAENKARCNAWSNEHKETQQIKKKEYYHLHKNEPNTIIRKNEYNHNYHVENSAKIEAKRSVRITCECGWEGRKDAKARHIKTKFHLANI